MIKVKNYTDKAEIYIYGDIVTDTDATWLKMNDDGTLGYQYPTKVREKLDEIQGKPVDVHIASDGGDVAAGIAIYNILAAHDAPVTVYVDNWVASIASVIAFAGQKIIMPENTFLMVHNPAASAFGDATYLRSVADWLDKLRTMIAETYAKHITATPDGVTTALEVVTDLMDNETWLTAAQAADIFDIVELVEANDVKAVASLKSGFKSCPMNNINNIKNSIISVLKRSFDNEEKGRNVESD